MKLLKKSLSPNTIMSLLLLMVFSLLLGMGVLLVRTKLLQNTQNLGMSLAQSYGTEEEMYLERYRQNLELGSAYVEDLWQRGEDSEEIQQWLHDYFQKLIAIVGENTFDAYAVLNDSIVAANPWEGDDTYNYQDTEWYKNAIEANGEIVFTGAYQDAVTGRMVITAARKFRFSDDVMAMDLYPDSFQKAEG